MVDYDNFYKFYDVAIGDRSKMIGNIQKLIAEYKPNSKNVLELACGTGEILAALGKKYHKFGVDLSKKMLALAKKKLPEADFIQEDMVNFKLNNKFDLIFCLFDSVNHLLSFEDWEKFFVNSFNHLNEDGVFIFDINTLFKLEKSSQQSTWIRQMDKNIMLMKVNSIGKLFEWKIQIFEWKNANNYQLHEENIKEVSFPVKDVLKVLKNIFGSVALVDFDNSKVTSKSERVYFICKKKIEVKKSKFF